MKNKNIIGFFLILLIAACEPLDDLRDEYKIPPESFSYTLTQDDYETIAEQALYFNPEDTENAEFIENQQYFTENIPSTRYVPMLLDKMFPGKPVASAADITINYNSNIPDDLNKYISAEYYQLTKDDYAAANSNFDKYFPSTSNPDIYLPKILENNIETPNNEQIVSVAYIQPQSNNEAFKLNASMEEVFSSDIGRFNAINVKGEQQWSWASLGGGTGTMGIVGWQSKYFENEDWLISEKIDISGSKKTILQFVNAIDYYKEGFVSVLISENYDQADIHAATWNEIEVPQWKNIDDRTGMEGQYKNVYEESGVIDLSEYDGKKIYIAFKYISSLNVAPYWSVKEVAVGTYYWLNQTYYQYNGKSWIKQENVYKLKPADYDAMGKPAAYNNFSASIDPRDYLPNLLNAKYPLAGNEASKTLIYNYYTGTNGTIVWADKYTKTDGKWNSSSNYIKKVVEPYKMSTTGWVFDPTVIHTLTNEDFQLIVDYVNSNDDLPNTHPYPENTENYYGASAYYTNFDIVSDGSWNKSAFSSWEEAVTAALRDAYLPNAFPDATAFSGGVEVFYILTFDTYSGARQYYTMKFKVVKDAPNPKFELIEGPIPN